MVNNLIDAISRSLNAEFTDKYNIYMDKVVQGLEEPCFFIDVISTSQHNRLNNRKLRENIIQIIFIPESGKIRECNDIKERLYSCLEYITLIDNENKEHIIHCLNMEDSISDNVLIFVVTYNYHITYSKEKIYMNNLNQKGALK